MIERAKLVSIIIKIMFDKRFDWPTNGALIALIQFCHLSLQENDVYL